MGIIAHTKNAVCSFVQQRAGNVAITFAHASLPVVGVVGFAVDYSHANSVKVATQGAPDATARRPARGAAAKRPAKKAGRKAGKKPARGEGPKAKAGKGGAAKSAARRSSGAKKSVTKAAPPAGVPAMLGGAPTSSRGLDDGEE